MENRLLQYRTILAQERIEGEISKIGGKWDERQYQTNISKTQDEVAEHIKQYRIFHKEGKYKEALAEARKAKELDPNNTAADAAITIVSTIIAEQEYHKGNAQNAEFLLKGLNPDNGPYVSMTGPVAYDPERLKQAQNRKSALEGISWPTRDSKERYIEQRLREPISLSFKETPLHQVIDDLRLLSGINIVPDYRALQDANINLDTPLTLPVENISLQSALNILLKQVKLTYVISDQVLQITTQDTKKGGTRIVTYPVADLIIPVDNHPTPAIADLHVALARHLARATPA